MKTILALFFVLMTSQCGADSCHSFTVCNGETPSHPTGPVIPVKRGKMGPRGEKGEKGETGRKGTDSSGEVEEKISNATARVGCLEEDVERRSYCILLIK